MWSEVDERMDEIDGWSDILDFGMCAPAVLEVALACDRLPIRHKEGNL